MARFSRFQYGSVLPLGRDGRRVTASPRHLSVSKEAAIEGTVLLKNDGVLPLKPGQKVCLFGRGAGEFIFGGGGSGNVLSDVRVGLAEGLEMADEAGKIQLFRPLIDEARRKAKEEKSDPSLDPKEYRRLLAQRDFSPFPVEQETYEAARRFGGIAILSIVRYSSEDTRFGDRAGAAGGFGLTRDETDLLDRLGRDFESVVVILTVCGPVETLPFARHPKVGALLYPLYGGSLAGVALTEILLGEKEPSGHLQDTLAQSISDYPTTKTYGESDDYVNYEEDIFIGYRYFETFCPEKVVYPFGFGLSYTTFSLRCRTASRRQNTVSLGVQVKNTGARPGKEVVQVYLSAPQGKLGKPAKVLCAFGKTPRLLPGEETELRLSFDLRELASYDDVGKVAQNAFVLEKGEYRVLLGANVRECRQVLAFSLEADQICRRTQPYLAPAKLPRRLLADGSYETLPAGKKLPHPPLAVSLKKTDCALTLEKALEEGKLEEFVGSMSDEDLAQLLYGHPAICAATTGFIGMPPKGRAASGQVDRLGIPPVPTADGPAGLRTAPCSGVSTTYFPAGNTLSQTWNLALVRRVGVTAAREVKENNAGIWLAPGMNLHRSPLCGRNFEYYSEDPLTTGLIAAAMVKGVQSQKISATVKHFACNNKEGNRKLSDSRVSQRALRELYLKGFEIAVKKADPWCIMSSYNLINGTHASANYELLTGILKGEWKFRGVVMTDWWTYEPIAREALAGGDVKMPYHVNSANPKGKGNGPVEKLIAGGAIPREVANGAALRILRLFGHLE